jgi:Ca2+-binding RTX toxin-like protein
LQSPLFDFRHFGTVTVNPGAGGFEQVVINGTEGADSFTSPAGDAVALAGGVRVNLAAGVDRVDVNSLGGNDTIDLGLTSATLVKVINAGAGNDVVDMLDSVDATIYGGDGDDTITGSPAADLIFGGRGNDVLVGAAGVDQIYGEDGDDRIGDPLPRDITANDPGNDFFFGGAGSDVFFWDPGDGSDTIEGGSGEADVLSFFGSAAAETFNVFANLTNPARAVLFRSVGAITINMAGIDQIDVSGNGGADRFVVGRANNGDAGDDPATSPYTDPTATLSTLSTTEVRVVNLDAGAADGAGDLVFVDGRPANDNLVVSLESAATSVVRVAGLSADVRILNAVLADGDRLTVRGNEGDDVVKAVNPTSGGALSVESVIGITLAGGQGDDTLSADAILIGGIGNDFLEGGAGVDQLFGNEGEDTMIGGAGLDTFDGGPDFDTILIRGTTGNDRIDANQTAAGTLVHTVNGVTETDTLVTVAGVRTVERVKIDAGAGDDIIRVQWADSLGQSVVVDSVRFDVDGGADATRDRLAVVDAGTGDLVLYRKGESDSEGSMTVGPDEEEPLEAVFVGIEYAEPVLGAGGRTVVFKHDPFEYNNDRLVATHLGANEALNVDPTVDPGADVPFGLPGDRDWYQLEAEVNGTLDIQVFFQQIATVTSGREGLPGDGDLSINVRDAVGNIIAGFGANDATDNERVRIPAVAGQIYYLEVFGAGDAINNYNLTIINLPAPVPFDIELQDTPVGDPPPVNSDTGRSQFDNHTRDTTPTLYLRLDDGGFRFDVQGNDPGAGGFPNNPIDEVIPIPFQTILLPGYRVAIFDEGPTPAQPATNPQIPLGFATEVPGSPGLYTFTTPVLSQGSHFLTARVQMVDPSTPVQTGFGERSLSLEIVVDIEPPVPFFGVISLANTTQGLDQADDTGVLGDPNLPSTFTDRITSVKTPQLYGTAEANAIVRIWLDANGNGTLQSGVDTFLGKTVALPTDGTNQFPLGQWWFDVARDLNDPTLPGLTLDGLRTFFVTGEDLAGNVTPDGSADAYQIFLDTQGPQITNVQITGSPAFNLFGLKPGNAAQGPTPLVNSLTISVQDLPNRIAAFLYNALAADAVDPNLPAEAQGSIHVVGDASGVIPILDIEFNPDPLVPGFPATGTIVLTFTQPGPDGLLNTADDIGGALPDDRFTLTIEDNLVDPAGNKLDGESNAQQPVGVPAFPSGDHVPGGDFVARFTVDSRAEVGTWGAGTAWIDINGNGSFDPDNVDYVNRDLSYVLGITSDDVFAGNFSPPGPGQVADGFDKLAAYGPVGAGRRWLIDTDNDGVPNPVGGIVEPLNINGFPVAGNFDTNAVNGDEVGVFTGAPLYRWYFDAVGHNYQLDTFITTTQLSGYPIVGDFDGDGFDDLGAAADDRFTFLLTNGADRAWLFGAAVFRTINFDLIGVRERPVAADMDGDGIDDIGYFVPDRAGGTAGEGGEWYFLLSDFAEPIFGQVNTLNHEFSPTPLGSDLHISFGDEYALPVIGNFDPPIGPADGETAPAFLDVNLDGQITALDALVVINLLNANGSGLEAEDARIPAQFRPDVNRDGSLTPLDALTIINFLNDRTGAGEGEARSTFVAVAVDVAEGEGTQASTVTLVSALPVSVGEQLSTLPLGSGLTSDNDDDADATRVTEAARNQIYADLARSPSDNQTRENAASDEELLSVLAGSGEEAVLDAELEAFASGTNAAGCGLAVDEVLRRLYA